MEACLRQIALRYKKHGFHGPLLFTTDLCCSEYQVGQQTPSRAAIDFTCVLPSPSRQMLARIFETLRDERVFAMSDFDFEPLKLPSRIDVDRVYLTQRSSIDVSALPCSRGLSTQSG